MEHRLRWNGNIDAQRCADAAYNRLRPKKKPQPKRRKKNRRNRRSQTKVPYQEYIVSHKWRNVRRRKLKEVGYKCERCGSRGWLQVHHKTYVRLGREHMSDLEVLCKHCHEDEHADKVIPTDAISLEFAEMVQSF